MKKHIFLISAIRPELLVEQIGSFMRYRGTRELKFYVFNDKNENDDKFQTAVSTLCERYSDIYIYYFNLAEQVKILHTAASKYSPILQENERNILDCFKEDGRFQGLRSIQNKSVFIFYLVNKDRGSIVHRLDDDIFAYEAVLNQDTVDIVLKADFYSSKEKILGDNFLLISGSNYTIDSPSPLAQYADFMEFLHNFYYLAKNRESGACIGSDMLMISPAKVSTVNDPLQLLQILPPNQSMTYHEVLLFLERHIDVLLNGNSRLVINDNREKSFGSKSIFPGGCVSFLYENLPILTPHFGNQDLLRQLFEIIDGKKLCADGYIGHRKSSTERPSIIDDLKKVSYRHQTHITYSIFDYLKKNETCLDELKDFQEYYINIMNKWLQESLDYTKKIVMILKEESNWYTHESYRSTAIVKEICSNFLDSYSSISENFLSNDTPSTEFIINDYIKKKKIFDSLMKVIHEEKK